MKRESLWLSIVLALLVGLVACKKDEDSRDEFVGTYNAQESFSFGGDNFTDNYSFSITKSSSVSDRILLNGFADASGVTVEATVSGNSFSIPQQTIVVSGESVGVSGSGSRDGNRLTYSYSLSTVNLSLNISGTANKL
jgi:hypothetical protein